jgi:hypothetical protein
LELKVSKPVGFGGPSYFKEYYKNGDQTHIAMTNHHCGDGGKIQTEKVAVAMAVVAA